MIYENSLTGKYVSLRSAIEEDAAFIIEIRNDSSKNGFVHDVDYDLQKEVKWIRDQQHREGYYFFSIVSHKKEEIVGNISICNIDKSQNNGELGRWVSYGSSIENLESVILTHDFAFDVLGLDYVYTKTLQDNKKVVSFWKRFGGLGENNKIMCGKTIYYNVVNRLDYKGSIRNKFVKLLEG